VSALIRETVLAAIQFNIQFRRFTKEIEIVFAKWMLSAEFVAIEPPVTQPAPYKLFRPGFLFAELAGAFGVSHVTECKTPGGKMKFVLTPALTLTLSPGERGQRSDIPGSTDAARPVPAFEFSEKRRIIFPLLEERAGVRTD
jgi:hypothetical protein